MDAPGNTIAKLARTCSVTFCFLYFYTIYKPALKLMYTVCCTYFPCLFTTIPRMLQQQSFLARRARTLLLCAWLLRTGLCFVFLARVCSDLVATFPGNQTRRRIWNANISREKWGLHDEKVMVDNDWSGQGGLYFSHQPAETRCRLLLSLILQIVWRTNWSRMSPCQTHRASNARPANVSP